MYTCICAHTNTCGYIYTHTHTHTYTHVYAVDTLSATSFAVCRKFSVNRQYPHMFMSIQYTSHHKIVNKDTQNLSSSLFSDISSKLSASPRFNFILKVCAAETTDPDVTVPGEGAEGTIGMEEDDEEEEEEAKEQMVISRASSTSSSSSSFSSFNWQFRILMLTLKPGAT